MPVRNTLKYIDNMWTDCDLQYTMDCLKSYWKHFILIFCNVCVVGPPPVSSGFTLQFSYWQRAAERTPTPVTTRELYIKKNCPEIKSKDSFLVA